MVDLLADGYETTSLTDAHKAVLALTDTFLVDPGTGPDGAVQDALLTHYGAAGTVELTCGSGPLHGLFQDRRGPGGLS